MSRGPGRCQRRICELLETAPERRMNRLELDRVLVEDEGFDPSNLLRSIRRLERVHRVTLRDARHKADAIVCLRRKEVELVPESKLAELLAEIAG